MVILKNKIKTIESLPPSEKKTFSIIKLITTVLFIIIFITTLYYSYINIFPYLNAVKIIKITGKKTNITICNTKDYIIIGEDKSYSLSLTNNDCITNHYEGTITIKSNEIIFNNNIKGLIDNNYNIIINNKIFESDKDE